MIGPKVPKVLKTCAVADCERSVRSSGATLCEMHYYRLRRTGTTSARANVPNPQLAVRNAAMRAQYEAGQSTTQIAAEFGLTAGAVSRALRAVGCRMRPFVMRGQESPQWNASGSYSAVHQRLRNVRGSASKHLCKCGRAAKHWAYLHDAADEQTSQMGVFSTDLSRYAPMCVSCHKRFDLGRPAS